MFEKISWREEFSGNLSKWNIDIGVNYYNYQNLEYLSDLNAVVSNGTFKLLAKVEKVSDRDFTTARIISKNSFTYGVIEARLKLPIAKPSVPLWPAFWMLSATTPLRWPYDGF